MKEIEKPKKRVKHVDIAKGISITLVALYHSDVKDFFPELMYAMSLFRMPLFFFLSGVFFFYLTPPKKFFFKKADALLKPYYFVLTLVFIFCTLFTSDNTLWQLRGMLYGTGDTIKWVSMWFLTHLFVVYCFSYLLFRYTVFERLRAARKWLVLLIFLAIGTLNVDLFWNLNVSLIGHSIILPGLPFSLDIVLITSVFFISGYLLKNKVINFQLNFLLLFISISVFSYISMYTDALINFNDRVYTRPLLSTLAAICGIYIVICISYFLGKINCIGYSFTKLGEASLYILIFHAFIDKQMVILINYIIGENDIELLIGFLAFILCLLMPLVIKWIICRSNILVLFFMPLHSNKLLQRNKAKFAIK